MLPPSASQVPTAALTAPSVVGTESEGESWEGRKRKASPFDSEAALEVDNTAELFAASGLAMVEGGLEPADYPANDSEGA